MFLIWDNPARLHHQRIGTPLQNWDPKPRWIVCFVKETQAWRAGALTSFNYINALTTLTYYNNVDDVILIDNTPSFEDMFPHRAVT